MNNICNVEGFSKYFWFTLDSFDSKFRSSNPLLKYIIWFQMSYCLHILIICFNFKGKLVQIQLKFKRKHELVEIKESSFPHSNGKWIPIDYLCTF